MCPRLIRMKPASNVAQSAQLREFLDNCNNEWLKGRTEEALSELKAHYETGTKVQKDKWPRYYRKQWGIKNLFVHRLGPDWRLTYTLVSDAVGIAVFCLEILPHREYDKRFGYHTS